MKRTLCWVFILVLVISIGILGCAKKEEEKKEIKIGVITALTGPGAKYGESSKRGIDLAVEDANSSGGITGMKVTAIYEDYQTDPKLAVSAIQKLITTRNVFVIIGAAGSSEILAMAPIAEKNKVILFAPSASAPAITQAGDFIFRNVASDIYEGSVMAEYAKNTLKVQSAAVIYINNDFGIGLKDSFGKRFREIGGTIALEQSFNPDESDFRSQLAKIKAAKTNAVYIVGFKEIGLLLRQAAELGVKVKFLSFTMFEDPDILKVAGKAAEGVYFTSQAFDPESPYDIVQTFVKRFKQKYQIAPDIFAALSYDASRILISAIEKGGYSSDKIKDALYRTKDFPGVTGTTTFASNGDVVKAIGIKVVKNGQFVWVESPH